MRAHHFLTFWSIIFCALASHLEAQQVSPDSKPTAPYLARIPDNCHWVVNFSYPSNDASGKGPIPSPAAYPLSIETSKVGSMRHIEIKFLNSPSQQFDIVDNHIFSQGPLGLEYRPLGGDYTPCMFFDLGFAFTQCVKLASFKELSTYQNVPAFHYQDNTTEAWISVATHLPIGANLVGFAKTTYQYLPPPSADAVKLTPEEQKLLRELKANTEKFEKLR